MRYPWKRFWVPRDSAIKLSPDGFFPDPESIWGKAINPQVVSLDDTHDIPCLVLLGDPGIGKTTALEQAKEHLERAKASITRQVLWFDLGEYGSEDRLIREVFENATLRDWIKGQDRLYLFLDSLDAGPLGIATLTRLLCRKLQRLPVERLYLRIACRSADWPAGLEEEFKRLWQDNVQVLQMAPLRRMDVEEAARLSNVDPEGFLKEIIRLGAVPLAIKPVTLQFLLRLYQKQNQLPSTQTELYLKGCTILCDEHPESNRRDGNLINAVRGLCSPQQRLAVAARIAALTVFANRYAVWIRTDLGDMPDEDVHISNLCGGTEKSDDGEVTVTEPVVREVLATALFTMRGPNRIGWAHQTYAEFLAAWYLYRRQVPSRTIMNLVTHPNDPDGSVIPQLRGVTAWLAVMERDVFESILRVQPELLLRSDAVILSPHDRAALVEALLSRPPETFAPDMFAYYGKLCHDSLSEQLRRAIIDPTSPEWVKHVAIDIAEACRVTELGPDLAKIAVNPTESLQARINAAWAVVRINDEQSKAMLRPLAINPPPEDDDDELKGCALRAVWPQHLSAAELFAVLTPPKRDNFIGAYALFLNELKEHLTDQLRPSDLPIALDWAGQQAKRRFDHRLRDIALGILDMSLNYLDNPNVLQAFARASLSYLKEHHRQLSRRLSRSNQVGSLPLEHRVALLDAMVPLALNTGNGRIISDLAITTPRIIEEEDLPWLLDRFYSAPTEDMRHALLDLIRSVFNPNNLQHMEIMYEACKHDPLLAEHFSPLFRPVLLDSPEAARLRSRFYGAVQSSVKPHPTPSLVERIHQLLERFEQTGDPDAWWQLHRLMTFNPDGTSGASEFEWDLTKLPGWEAAPPALRVRIVAGAKRYVCEQNDEPQEWLEDNYFYLPAAAGYRALQLLLSFEPEFLERLPPSVWEQWVTIILAYPARTNEQEPHQRLVRMAYERIPEQVINTLMLLIDHENSRRDDAYLIWKMSLCWDDRLVNALLAKIQSETLKPRYMSGLLGELLKRGVKGATYYAKSLVERYFHGETDLRERAIYASCELLLGTDDASWDLLWPLFEKDPDFGRAVVEQLVSNRDCRKNEYYLAHKLSEQEIAKFYVWLATMYPHAQDPPLEEFSIRREIAEYRNSLLYFLRDRGTQAAYDALQWVAKQLPELPFWPRLLREATERYRERNWTPPDPLSVLKVLTSKERRLVQSGEQLLEVLIESLQRLQEKLHGETPLAIFLWDEVSRGVYRPKRESALADFIKAHLNEDLVQRGVVANREVQIRSGMGSTRGERVDIHVNAVVQDPNREVLDGIRAIIEVKGCWNRDVRTAMKEQLVDRYMADNPGCHGLYVVVWFPPSQWDPEDYRRAQVPFSSLKHAQEDLAAEAERLTNNSRIVRTFVLDATLR